MNFAQLPPFPLKSPSKQKGEREEKRRGGKGITSACNKKESVPQLVEIHIMELYAAVKGSGGYTQPVTDVTFR